MNELNEKIETFKKKANEIFSRYKIKPLRSVEEFAETIFMGKYKYHTVCLDQAGRKYFFKSYFMGAEQGDPSLKNEIVFSRALMESMERANNYNTDDFGLKMQKCVDLDRQNYEWIIYDYVEGRDMGNMFSFYGDTITKPSSFNLVKITDFVGNLQNILLANKKKFDSLNLNKQDYKFFASYLVNNAFYFENILGNQKMQKVLNYFAANKDLLEDCHCLIHRDNHTMNFVMDDKDEIIVIDWSSASFGNYLSDFAEIWVHAYEFPDWQKKAIEMYMENNGNKKGINELFKMMDFYSTLKEIKHLSNFNFVVKVLGGDKETAGLFRKKAIDIHSERIKKII